MTSTIVQASSCLNESVQCLAGEAKWGEEAQFRWRK